MYCQNCGFNNNENCNFCVNCGSPLKSGQPAVNDETAHETYGTDDKARQNGQPKPERPGAASAERRTPRRIPQDNPKSSGAKFIIAVVAIALVAGGAAFGIVHHLMTSHQARTPDYTASEDDAVYEDGSDSADPDDGDTSESYDSSDSNDLSSYDSDDYIVPESSSRLLTASDLSGLSNRTVQYAINEIFARHGAEFEDARVKAYFNDKSWYNAYQSKDKAQEDFNTTEIKNVDFMKAYIEH